jgi:hypothetical protein
MKAFFGSLKPNAFLFALGLILFSASTLTMQSCAAKPDPTGLGNATNLGTKLTDMMGKATEPFGKHSKAVASLLEELNKAAEHSCGQKKNKEICESWKTLTNDQAKPFFDRWKEKGVLDKDYVKEAVGIMGKSLDAIKQAELAKNK